MIRLGTTSVLALAIATPAIWAAPALAQSEGNAATQQLEDIIVTARKRDETSISVPVAITAVSAEQIERAAISNIDSLAQRIPTLITGEGGGTVQGGAVVLRGISGTDTNPFADQAVSFNVDGVQVARSSIRRMAEMDLAQVEVLKGPQSLFFGKNSPGGIISIRTADPTDTLQGKASLGYEAYAREYRAEAFIAGPLSDTVGFRIAGYFSDMEGWAKSQVPATSALQPQSRRAPGERDWALRGTLKFEPNDKFNARLKLTYGKRDGADSAANVQFVNCTLGRPNAGGALPVGGAIDDCTADDRVWVASPGTSYDIPSLFNPDNDGSGRLYLKQTQVLGSLEMNYNVTDQLTLTSVTGYYKVDLDNYANYTASYFAPRVLPSNNIMEIKEISQELRLFSNFEGQLNFMIGGHFQDSKAFTGSNTFLGAPTGLQINDYKFKQDGTAYSVFGQILYDVLPTVELSVGGRYSHEKKKLPYVDFSGTGGNIPVVQTGFDRDISFNDFSPEATISWRPTDMMTVYGSYKQGFMSGGFNSASPGLPIVDLSYKPQETEGFEVGVKSAFLDGALRTNLAAFSYKTTNMQVAVTTQGTIQELKNAGSIRTKGVEFDFNYRPPVDGLTISGAIAYLKGTYLDYQASCYAGQSLVSTPACTPQTSRVTNQVALLQDLSGTELLRAPDWSGNLGFTYDTPITDTLKIGFTGDVNFSSSYLTDATSLPTGRSPSYQQFNASFRVADIEDKWELALIGKNLTEEYYWVRTSIAPFSGTAVGSVAAPRATAGVNGDAIASVSRGRQIMLRLTIKH